MREFPLIPKALKPIEKGLITIQFKGFELIERKVSEGISPHLSVRYHAIQMAFRAARRAPDPDGASASAGVENMEVGSHYRLPTLRAFNGPFSPQRTTRDPHERKLVGPPSLNPFFHRDLQ